MIQTISILGCGWLGLPLGKFLAEKKFKVKGTTTHEEKIGELKSAGIEPYLIQLNPTYNGQGMDNFLASDLLIINIPPSLRSQSEEFHIQQMNDMLHHLKNSSIKNIIYISSTSVYPDLNKELIEGDVTILEQADSKTLFQVEEIFRNASQFKTLIIRCAGLAGYNRNLVKHFAGKSELKMGNAPVNLIHRDDVVEIIYSLIKNDRWNETYNICAPVHPLRKDLYPFLAEKYKYDIPHYDLKDSSPYKIINIEKLLRDIHYQFKFSDPKYFFYEQ